MPLDDIRKKWGTIFMGEREATVEELDAMQEPARREQVRQKVQEDYMERVREKATQRARQILGEAYTERQKVLNEARAEARRQYDLVLAEAEKIRQSSREAHAAMQAELEKAAAIKAEALQIREEARRIHENAFTEGHAAGVEHAENELREFRGELGQHLAHVLQAVAAQFRAINAQWREDLAELTRTAVASATGYALDSQHEAVVRALLMDALSMLENRATITVRVHPDDEKMVGSLFKAARERSPELQNWVVNGDSSLEQGGFIVETSSGSVDARRECFRELVNNVLQHLALPGTDLDRQVEQTATELVEREIAYIKNLAPCAAQQVSEAVADTVAASTPQPDLVKVLPDDSPEHVPSVSMEQTVAEGSAGADRSEQDLSGMETSMQEEGSFDDVMLPEETADNMPEPEESLAFDEEPSPALSEPSDALMDDMDASLPPVPDTPASFVENEPLPEPREKSSPLEELEDELFPLEEPPATPSVQPAVVQAPQAPQEVLERGGFLPGT